MSSTLQKNPLANSWAAVLPARSAAPVHLCSTTKTWPLLQQLLRAFSDKHHLQFCVLQKYFEGLGKAVCSPGPRRAGLRIYLRSQLKWHVNNVLKEALHTARSQDRTVWHQGLEFYMASKSNNTALQKESSPRANKIEIFLAEKAVETECSGETPRKHDMLWFFPAGHLNGIPRKSTEAADRLHYTGRQKIQCFPPSNIGGVAVLISNVVRVQNPWTCELGTQRHGHTVRHTHHHHRHQLPSWIQSNILPRAKLSTKLKSKEKLPQASGASPEAIVYTTQLQTHKQKWPRAMQYQT